MKIILNSENNSFEQLRLELEDEYIILSVFDLDSHSYKTSVKVRKADLKNVIKALEILNGSPKNE